MMIKPKKISLLIAACITLLATASTTKAQTAGKLFKESTPEQRAQLQTGMMKSKLKLDSTQVTKIQVINLKYAQKLDPIIKGDGSKFKMMRQAMLIQKDKDAELKTTLTDEQYKDYDKMKDEMKDKLKAYKQYK